MKPNQVNEIYRRAKSAQKRPSRSKRLNKTRRLQSSTNQTGTVQRKKCGCGGKKKRRP